MGLGKAKATAGGILPEFSKFYCHPGRAGGSTFWISPIRLIKRNADFEASTSPNAAVPNPPIAVMIWLTGALLNSTAVLGSANICVSFHSRTYMVQTHPGKEQFDAQQRTPESLRIPASF